MIPHCYQRTRATHPRNNQPTAQEEPAPVNEIETDLPASYVAKLYGLQQVNIWSQSDAVRVGDKKTPLRRRA